LSASGKVGIGFGASVVVSNPVVIGGKRVLVTTAKGGSDGAIWNGTIKRTIRGERAPLQIKSVAVSGRVVILHLHCLKDKRQSAYNRGTPPKLRDLYRITKVDGVRRIKCRICKRVWFNDGWVGERHP
jgi:hypothetical protein